MTEEEEEVQESREPSVEILQRLSLVIHSSVHSIAQQQYKAAVGMQRICRGRFARGQVEYKKACVHRIQRWWRRVTPENEMANPVMGLLQGTRDEIYEHVQVETIMMQF